MGKKAKIGKARKDKFYQLAKETGYRSRAAFKLIQLNRKYEFLQTSRVVVDLCAAPGGWAQVAAENTPISSLIVAIDLVPIRPIHKVTCLLDDITTEKCRQNLKKELQSWKADCFLNDGAPNVGKNWLHDAFQQAQLTLSAMKLATEFLRKGGWFITKVFRSKDYNALLWAFQQLFKHVHATKPQASRNESAEIFVVCQGYLAPDKIDPKFLDPKYVFKEVQLEPTTVPLNMVHPEKRRRHTEGYPEGDYTLFHPVNVSEFINSDKFMELISTVNQITLDDERVSSHSLTTAEIVECCKDLKVLGKKELRKLLSWRKKMKQYLEELEEKPVDKSQAEEKPEEDEDEEAKIEKLLVEVKEGERKALKQKLKKIRREKLKLRHKMDLKMIVPGDVHDFSDDVGLFQLEKIKNKAQLSEVEAGDLSLLDGDILEESDEEVDQTRPVVLYDRDSKDYLDPTEDGDSEREEEALPGDSNDNDTEDDEEEGNNPLVVSLEDKSAKKTREYNNWFSKDVFAGLENDEDENIELENITAQYRSQGGLVIDDIKGKKKATSTDEKEAVKCKSKSVEGRDEDNNSRTVDFDSGNESQSDEDSRVQSDSQSDSDSDSASDYDESALLDNNNTKTVERKKKKKLNNANKDGFEVVPAHIEGVTPHLDAVGLAMGAAMATSRKRKRDIIDDAYNRYAFDDENLPSWFTVDEKRHNKRPLPVTKEEVLEYKQREREIDARPIKKVAEAKARRKHKTMKKLEKVRKKSEVIFDTGDTSEREKWSQIKHIYKKAGLLKKKKKEVTYVVAKKGAGKRVRRPAGVQGAFKVVDKRMKKDLHKEKAQDKRKTKGRKGKKR